MIKARNVKEIILENVKPETIMDLLNKHRQVHLKSIAFGLTIFRLRGRICIASHNTIYCNDDVNVVEKLHKKLTNLHKVKVVLFD